MIRFPCPKCEKRLAVGDELAGRIAACPNCKNKVRIPGLAPAADDGGKKSEAPAPPSKPGGASGVAKREAAAAEAPIRRPAEPAEEEVEELEEVEDLEEVEEVEEAEDQDEPVRARRAIDAEDDDDLPRRQGVKQRKFRKRGGGGWDWFSGETMLNKAVLAAISICLMLAILGIFLPFLLLIPLLLSIGMLLTAHVMVLLAAFQDDSTTGCMCLIIPFYVWYFIITRFDQVRSAVLLYVGSVILVIVSSVSMAIAGTLWHAVAPPPRHMEIPWPAVVRTENA